jgi:ParB-like nuclease domain
VAARQAEIAVADLRLDPQNPRLPEELQGAEQPRLLRYLYDNGALDELIRSFADNGFFRHEPLIVVASDDLDGYVVLEGNRRLCALKILLGEPDAQEEGLEPQLDERVDDARLDELRVVPCYLVDDPLDVHQFLGFRHIGGIKTWSAEAKARYLLSETEREAEAGAPNPFGDVARRVGSNAQGVRNSYLALALLRHARDEFEIQVRHVMEERFGVWLRCMNAQDIRRYVGLDSPRRYEEVREQIVRTSGERLREVVGDLTPRGEQRPVLWDSRDVTVYGQVLTNPVAHDALRKYEDLTTARQIVQLAELPQRLRTLRSQIDVAALEAQQAEPTDDLVQAAEALSAAARALRATVRDRLEDRHGD